MRGKHIVSELILIFKIYDKNVVVHVKFIQSKWFMKLMQANFEVEFAVMVVTRSACNNIYNFCYLFTCVFLFVVSISLIIFLICPLFISFSPYSAQADANVCIPAHIYIYVLFLRFVMFAQLCMKRAAYV